MRGGRRSSSTPSRPGPRRACSRRCRTVRAAGRGWGLGAASPWAGRVRCEGTHGGIGAVLHVDGRIACRGESFGVFAVVGDGFQFARTGFGVVGEHGRYEPSVGGTRAAGDAHFVGAEREAELFKRARGGRFGCAHGRAFRVLHVDRRAADRAAFGARAFLRSAHHPDLQGRLHHFHRGGPGGRDFEFGRFDGADRFRGVGPAAAAAGRVLLRGGGRGGRFWG